MRARPLLLALALLDGVLASSCDRPHEVRVPVVASAVDAHPALAEPLDAGGAEDASPPLEDAAEPPTPRWASGSVSDRLYALRVNDDNWARRDLVTWTTPQQVDALRSSRVLLVATAYTRGPPSPFVWLLSKLAGRKGALGALAGALSTDARFSRRRYAWSAGYATVLGLAAKRYGDELVQVRLREDALVVAIAPEREPPISVRDLEQHEVHLERAIEQAARIGAVYHVRTGKDVPARFREYVLVNEAAIERWSVGTPSLHAEVEAEVALLRDLLAQIGSTPAARPSGPLEAWQHVGTGDPLRALWEGTLAFQNDRYLLDAPRLSAAIEALEEYDRGAPLLEVRP
jgi:hypothetical protein